MEYVRFEVARVPRRCDWPDPACSAIGNEKATSQFRDVAFRIYGDWFG